MVAKIFARFARNYTYNPTILKILDPPLLLIGLYYSIRFGIGGCFTAINRYAFNFSTSGHLISCGTANYIMITAISLLSLVAFTIVARQYKLRERDEVVNVHLFAEEYYTK